MKFLIALLMPAFSWANSSVLTLLETQAAQSEQAVVVTPVSGVQVKVRIYEKFNGTWELKSEIPGVIGKKGFAPAGQKREGDRRTPTGTLRFMNAWGYDVNPGTKLDYTVVDHSDLFIDDVTSPDYNKWVRAPTDAKSFEKMKRKDDLYEFGVVLDHNMNPTIPGHGSAIFFHVWRIPTEGTEGCIAVERQNMMALLRWLNPQKSPVILLNPVL